LNKRKLRVLKWNEVKLILSQNKINNELILLFDLICKKLKKSSKDYFYLAEYKLGDKIIDNGTRTFENAEITNQYENFSEFDFKNDVLYSNDPLGLVIDNSLDVFLYNERKYHKGSYQKYRVPLGTIYSGSFFGTFGTLDSIFEIPTTFEHRDWNVVAGNISNLWVATDLHQKKSNDLLPSYLKIYFKDTDTQSEDKWLNFINEYYNEQKNLLCIYFTKTFVNELLNCGSNLLFKTAWDQSYNLRITQLKDNTISNLIIESNTTFKHNIVFLIEMYTYLYELINGQSSCLTIFNNSNHILNSSFYCFNEIIKSNSKSEKEKVEFVTFQFSKIENSGFGIVPIKNIPILNKYHINGLDPLIEDIIAIDACIKRAKKEKYCIKQFILGCSEKNQTENKEIITHEKFRTDYLNPLNLGVQKVNLNSSDFSSFLIVKKK
jgi:hypothetical protein